MREWLDEVGPRILGVIGFLTILNTLLIIGLYFRIAAPPMEASEPEARQVTGDAPENSAAPEFPNANAPRVPLNPNDLRDFFTKLMEPFDPAIDDVTLPSEAEIDEAIATEDFASEPAQRVFEMLEQAYQETARPLPPISEYAAH